MCVEARCLSGPYFSLSTPCFETGFALSLELTIERVIFPSIRVTREPTRPGFLHGFWEPKFMFSCLHTKHFTNNRLPSIWSLLILWLYLVYHKWDTPHKVTSNFLKTLRQQRLFSTDDQWRPLPCQSSSQPESGRLCSLFCLWSTSYEVVPYLMCSLFKYRSLPANLEKHASVPPPQLKGG